MTRKFLLFLIALASIAFGVLGPLQALTAIERFIIFSYKPPAASGGGNDIEIWTAPLSGTALSGDVITVNVPSGSFTTAVAAAFSNTHNAAPFDSNAALPSTSTSTSCPWTTSNANDILFGAADSNSLIVDSGWTAIALTGSSGILFSEYQIVSTTQSATTAATITGASGRCAAGAIIKGP
jgi:hypothetical protein